MIKSRQANADGTTLLVAGQQSDFPKLALSFADASNGIVTHA
nr:hypothetical protein [Spirosoma rhododendri]